MLVCLPAHQWTDQRRQCGYVSQVLACAEVASGYRLARQLRARTRNGHHLPNPALLLLHQGDCWQPVYQALKLDWLGRGPGTDEMFSLRSASVVAKRIERLASQAAVPD